MKGLGRKSLDSLRVGVVVLDPDDNPVLINPAARAMGLLRSGGEPGAIVAHPILRTLAGQVRRTGARREVELDLPGRSGAAQAPLGLHLRAVALNATHVAVEAADVTESHRLARVRRDFVANVSHELKTPIGALQLLAEALLDATEMPNEEVNGSEDLIAATALRRADPPRVGADGPAGQRAARADPAAGRRAVAPPRSRSRSTGCSPR
jgi:two-component system sensor histidine kinase SenX3